MTEMVSDKTRTLNRSQSYPKRTSAPNPHHASKMLLLLNLVVICVSALACSSSPPIKKRSIKTEKVEPTTRVKALEIHPGVTRLKPDCEQGEQERCNGLDDNCNGVIDEECGYQTGAVQITLSWDTGADIDLYVIDPSGEKIFFRKDRRDSSVGGHMDFDSRGDCRKEQEIDHIENIYWEGSEPPKGNYLVELHYFGPCDKSGQTQITVAISVAGELIGVFMRTMQPEEKAPIVSFTIP